MRIGISLLCAKKRRTGIENVAFNLIHSLAEVDRKNEYVIFLNNQSSDWFELPTQRFEVVNVKLTFQRSVWFWEHLFFHLDSRRKGLDLVHFPLVGGVVGYRGKNVVTIHDLNDYLGIYNVTLRQRLLCVAWYKANIPRASLVVTASQYVRNQILEYFGVAGDKVRVVYNGVDDRFCPLTKSASFHAKYELPKEYILFVGSSYRSKNIQRIIEAVWWLRQKKQLDHHLLIVGGPGDEAGSIRAFVKKRGLEGIVHFGGYFPDDDLPALYNHASLFVFPTLDEGFGIPPLEAMACGTPVMASDIPVFREVLGDAALMVDPNSVESIAEGISKALFDNSLRETLISKGFVRAGTYSWKKMAHAMIEIYEQAVNYK